MNYLLLILIALIICVIGLIWTLIAMNSEDTAYSGKKSMANLSLIYMLFIPVIIIGGIIAWIMF
ncbi:BshB3 potential contributor to bacillithiol synthesis [Virgibacillus byunsanensis]|uniref:BshB3 potential contributor to bacillithiol synthesis n=1 Tax=Virgibacillus byunsanensis TaxID=570945 RepID=A0ABW3LMR7_9BACI